MNNTTNILLLIVPLILSGCVTPGATTSRTSNTSDSKTEFSISESEAKNATYPPFPENFKSDIKMRIKYALKDPDSALFKDWSVHKAYLPVNPPEFGYTISVDVNAKNSYGGYNGYKDHSYWYTGKPIPYNGVEISYLSTERLYGSIGGKFPKSVELVYSDYQGMIEEKRTSQNIHASNNNQFYVYQNGTQYGPYTEGEIHKMINNEKLDRDDYIWTEGITEWSSVYDYFKNNQDIK